VLLTIHVFPGHVRLLRGGGSGFNPLSAVTHFELPSSLAFFKMTSKVPDHTALENDTSKVSHTLFF
jgi:hypothetical protein